VQRLHFIPPAGVGPPSAWTFGPVLGLNQTVVDLSNTSHVALEGMTVVDSLGVGVRAENVSGVSVRNCTVARHGQQGVFMAGATASGVTGCAVHSVGCAAIRAHGGEGSSLSRGGLSVTGNAVSRFALWKRTYEAGIHWAGVGNTYSDNHVSDGPHNCFLGGGNEATLPAGVGVDCVFERNVLDGCAFEAADTGAFYVCGQQGSAYVNRNNSIHNNSFLNIRNTVGTGVQSAGVQVSDVTNATH
jgi:hypothetical protein